MRSQLSLIGATLAAALMASGVQAQDPSQADPNATCAQTIIDQVITPCVAQVYAQEAALPGGPCSSSDWSCICSLQSGLIGCYSLCPGYEPADDLRFNKENCNGQHGVKNVQNNGTLSYTFGTLTASLTSFPGATSTGSSPTTTAAPESSAGSSSMSTVTSVPSVTSSAPASSSSSNVNSGAGFRSSSPSLINLGSSLGLAGLGLGLSVVFLG
ncbi:hypothetical protein OC845_005334 [Tilletia horrida]|nr:hypothetical protein OC845_005334 [Tilletia horrida]